MTWLLKRDGLVTLILFSFCGVMTYFLIRLEFFSDLSFLHQVPVSHLVTRFLKGDNTSSLKVTWKNQDAGTFMVRVIPGERPFLKSTGQVQFYVLNRCEKVHFDLECRLNKHHHVEKFRVHGSAGEIRYQVLVDTLQDLFRFEWEGVDAPFRWEFPLRELIQNGGEKLLQRLPDLPWGIPLPKRLPVSNLSEGWHGVASAVRIDRMGDWMDAYLLVTKSENSQWFKLWMSPTGDILEFDSSFGWRGKNVDFFEGVITSK